MKTRAGIASLVALFGTLLSLPPSELQAQQGPGQGLGRRFRRSHEIEAQLGAQLPNVAARYRMTEAQLRKTLQQDKSIRSDDATDLHYACAGMVAHPTVGLSSTATSSGTVAAGPYPENQTFLLHSRPNSTRKIYLDFNGHTTTGTSWNTAYAAGGNITTPAFDLDGVPTSFSTAELDRIQLIWLRVVEDFAPFDVDVTTEDPGVEALRRSTSLDGAYGIRVCIGGNYSDWFGASAGGVAYVGSFNWNSDTPCFVFPQALGGGNEKYVAEATSHEVGHTLGLTHDGQTNITEYYQGHADWAPIMGVGYYSSVVQWSKGEYSSANNLQDDLNVMQTYGAPLLPDSVGGTLAAASTLGGTTISVPGLIGQRTDADLYKFVTGAGNISFSAGVAAPSPNLDAQLTLYNSAGSVVATANPTGLASTLTATVPEGTYYIGVDGVGTGDAVTAYNDYGSLGQYTLNGTILPTNNQPPVAAASSTTPTSGTAPLVVTFSANGSYDADGTIVSYTWNFGDGTANGSGSTVAHTYTAAGNYTATLTVVDNAGLSATASVVVQVTAPAASVYVSGITMSKSTSRKGTVVTARVTVRSSNGNLVSGATVTGTWSGILTGSRSATTSTSGVASISSSRTTSVGNAIFTVTGISSSVGSYNAALNTVSTATVAVP
jgi:PKD repeat protein